MTELKNKTGATIKGGSYIFRPVVREMYKKEGIHVNELPADHVTLSLPISTSHTLSMFSAAGPFTNSEGSSDFFRNHDSAEVVHTADNASCFHNSFLSCLVAYPLVLFAGKGELCGSAFLTG